jgi:hypothetical protein
VSLRKAATALGGSILLPDTANVSASDIGAVWMNQAHGEETQTAVAVTFPTQRLIISYEEPAVPPALIRRWGQHRHGAKSLVKLVWLAGVPADAYPQRPESWGSIQFVARGATTVVLGHTDEASLRAVAQSMVDRASAKG